MKKYLNKKWLDPNRYLRANSPLMSQLPRFRYYNPSGDIWQNLTHTTIPHIHTAQIPLLRQTFA